MIKHGKILAFGQQIYEGHCGARISFLMIIPLCSSPRLPENGREAPVLPTGGEGRDIDTVMKRLNMVPIDPSQSALDINPKPANHNRPSHRHPRCEGKELSRCT